MEGIGILHDEFPCAHYAKARASLVAKLRLYLVDIGWQLAIAAVLIAHQVGNNLFVGRPETEVALMTILKA